MAEVPGRAGFRCALLAKTWGSRGDEGPLLRASSRGLLLRGPRAVHFAGPMASQVLQHRHDLRVWTAGGGWGRKSEYVIIASGCVGRGTGVTPMFQIIQGVVGDVMDPVRFIGIVIHAIGLSFLTGLLLWQAIVSMLYAAQR